MSCQVAVADGLLSADAHEPLVEIVRAALLHGVHVGTLEARHRTLGDALSSGDPLFSHRLVRAETVGPKGWLASPLAPRAAVGPDLACFSVGVPNRVHGVVLRVEPVVGFGQQRGLTVREAVSLARTLVERGCTLVTFSSDGTLLAALPRTGAGRGLAPAVAPVASEAHVVQAMMAPWEDVEELCRAAAPVLVHALDTHRAVVSVMDGAARLPARGTAIPDDVAAAFVLEDARA
jgi:hypothetical protein